MAPEIIAGRYAVERAIGRGGMGTVWLCRDQVLGRLVAVKEVGTSPTASGSDVRRALREARSAAALNHPHVVAVYDAVEDGEHNWLVMEYVPSRTLAQIIADDGPLEPERAAALVAQAAEGLAAAHARGTVHRDVKPSNILVDEDDRAKIMDFGIARTGGDDQLTQVGLISGTPAYFSPEVARGQDPGPPSDVWALGATLYAAVEGHPPFADDGNAMALLNRIVSEVPPPPRQARFLTGAILQMMTTDPEERWSMGQVAVELRRLTREYAEGGAPTTVLAAPATPAAAAPAAAAAWASSATDPPADPTPTPEPTAAPAPEPAPAPAAAPAAARPPGEDAPRRSRARGLLVALVALVLVGIGAVSVALATSDDPPATDPAATGPEEPAEETGEEPTEEPAPSETTEPTDEPSEEPAGTPTEEDPTESESAEPTGDVGSFARSYYSLLPSDTRAAYDLLSEGYRDGTSYGSYQGFWRTIDAVEVTGTTVVEDGSVVDVALTYRSDGSAQQETRRLYLEPAGDGYVIVDDEAV